MTTPMQFHVDISRDLYIYQWGKGASAMIDRHWYVNQQCPLTLSPFGFREKSLLVMSRPHTYIYIQSLHQIQSEFAQYDFRFTFGQVNFRLVSWAGGILLFVTIFSCVVIYFFYCLLFPLSYIYSLPLFPWIQIGKNKRSFSSSSVKASFSKCLAKFRDSNFAHDR